MNDLTPSHVMQHHPSALPAEGQMLGWPLVGEREELGLQEFLRLFRKHLRLIALCFVGTLLLTAVIMLLTPPAYTGKTTLLIERNTP
jgi:hypothetical protein